MSNELVVQQQSDLEYSKIRLYLIFEFM